MQMAHHMRQAPVGQATYVHAKAVLCQALEPWTPAFHQRATVKAMFEEPFCSIRGLVLIGLCTVGWSSQAGIPAVQCTKSLPMHGERDLLPHFSKRRAMHHSPLFPPDTHLILVTPSPNAMNGLSLSLLCTCTL